MKEKPLVGRSERGETSEQGEAHPAHEEKVGADDDRKGVGRGDRRAQRTRTFMPPNLHICEPDACHPGREP